MTNDGLLAAQRSPLPLAILGAVLVLGLSASPVRAQPGPMPEAPATPASSPQVRTEHYGLWVAAVDVGGVAASWAVDKPLFVGTYLLAAPAVHLFHGNVRTAMGSLGLRAGLAILGFAGGWMLSDCGYVDGPACQPDHRLAGIAIGTGAALLVDWFLLARKTRHEEVTPPPLVRAGSLRLYPEVQTSRTGSMLLGLRGTF